MVPARIAQALAPWLFGVCLDRWGADAVWISAGVGLLAFAALWPTARAGALGERSARPPRADEPSPAQRRTAAASCALLTGLVM